MESPLVPAGLLLMSGIMFHIVYSAVRSQDLSRNRALGIRTRATLASDAAWREGHRVAGPYVLAAALSAYTSAALCVAVATTTGGAGLLVGVSTGIGYLSVLVLLVIAGRVADGAARSVLDRDEQVLRRSERGGAQAADGAPDRSPPRDDLYGR